MACHLWCQLFSGLHVAAALLWVIPVRGGSEHFQSNTVEYTAAVQLSDTIIALTLSATCTAPLLVLVQLSLTHCCFLAHRVHSM